MSRSIKLQLCLLLLIGILCQSLAGKWKSPHDKKETTTSKPQKIRQSEEQEVEGAETQQQDSLSNDDEHGGHHGHHSHHHPIMKHHHGHGHGHDHGHTHGHVGMEFDLNTFLLITVGMMVLGSLCYPYFSKGEGGNGNGWSSRSYSNLNSFDLASTAEKVFSALDTFRKVYGKQ